MKHARFGFLLAIILVIAMALIIGDKLGLFNISSLVNAVTGSSKTYSGNNITFSYPSSWAQAPLSSLTSQAFGIPNSTNSTIILLEPQSLAGTNLSSVNSDFSVLVVERISANSSASLEEGLALFKALEGIILTEGTNQTSQNYSAGSLSEASYSYAYDFNLTNSLTGARLASPNAVYAFNGVYGLNLYVVFGVASGQQYVSNMISTASDVISGLKP